MVERAGARGWVAVIGLAVAAFVFNTSEFMPIGLLVDIAADLGVTEAQAGFIVSAYAWMVMLLSLPLTVLASRFGYRGQLICVTSVFLAGQVASALAVGFATLLAARLIVACAHAVFWAIATPAAVSVVAPVARERAMSVVIVGSTIATIAGLPLGRMVGLALGWRASFACIAAVALAVIAFCAAFFPRVPGGEPFRFREVPAMLRDRSLLLIYAVTVLMAGGFYTCYSYIEPFLQQQAHASAHAITALLMIFGAAGALGSIVFSRWYGRRPIAFACAAVAGVAASLLVLQPASASFPATLAALLIWGACGTAAGVAFQAQIIAVTSERSAPVAMSVFSGLYNLGIGSGAAIGGAVFSSLGVGVVGFAGGAIVAAGAALYGLAKGRSRLAR